MRMCARRTFNRPRFSWSRYRRESLSCWVDRPLDVTSKLVINVSGDDARGDESFHTPTRSAGGWWFARGP